MNDIPTTLAIASEHHRAGRTVEAERLYREVLAKAPGHPDALHLLGVARLQAGDAAEAASLITQAIAGDPEEARFHANLGHALNACGRDGDAAASFARALVLLCNAGEAWPNIGALCNLIRRYGAGERDIAAGIVARGYALGDVMRRCSLLFHLSGDLAHYETLVAAILAAPERFTLPSVHYAYWGMTMQIFQGQAATGDVRSFQSGPLNALYRHLVAEAKRAAGLDTRLGPRDRREAIARVLIVTNQMLGEGHQPTRDAIGLARRLMDAGRDVAILNANAMAAVPENGFVPEFAFNVEDTYRGDQTVVAEGVRVRMMSFPERRFGPDKIVAIIDRVRAFAPDAIIAFGGSNVVADLFASTHAVVCVPTTTGFVHSEARLVLGYAEGDRTGGRMGTDASRFRPFGFAFSRPEPVDGRSRASFGLPESGPLFVVVGNRLDTEVSGDFLDRLDAVLDRLPDAWIAFAGTAPDLPARLGVRRNAGRMKALGHVEAIGALYRVATAYLNPDRQGGGGSAAFALAEGLPVVTTGGDVAAVAGPDFTVAAEAFVSTCVELATNTAWSDERRAIARKRYATIDDPAVGTERLLAYCLEAQAAGFAPDR